MAAGWPVASNTTVGSEPWFSAFSASSSVMQVLNWASVRPEDWATRSRTPRMSPVWKISCWLRKMASRTVKYFSLPAQRAVRKPAAASSFGGVRNSLRV